MVSSQEELTISYIKELDVSDSFITTNEVAVFFSS